MREVQATAASFDAASGTARVLLDDGSVLEVPAVPLRTSGVRLLRVGQRVRLRVDEAGVVSAVSLLTLPFAAGPPE